MAKPVGPYTPLVRSGDWLICSGQIGIDQGAVVVGGLEPELRQAFANLTALLATEGATLENVVKTTVFLTDMAHYAEMNAVYVEEFGDHRPARSAVAVTGLPLGATVERSVGSGHLSESLTTLADWAAGNTTESLRRTVMGGTIVIIILLAVVVPVAIIMTGVAASALLGMVIKNDVDRSHEGSELLELSKKM